MSSRSTKVSRRPSARSSSSARRPLPASRALPARVLTCLPEVLEGRQLFAVTAPTLITATVDGGPANGPSGESSVSASGRYVVFSSFATNLVAGDTNGKEDIFLRDTVNNTTTLISKSLSGDLGNGDSSQPVINQDGTYVAFVSKASNLINGDTGGFADVFRYSIASPGLDLVSATNTAGTAFAGAGSSEPTISKDGTLVSFTSFATNYEGVADQNSPSKNFNDVYVRNMAAAGTAAQFGINPGQVRLVSRAAAVNNSGDGESFDSSISADGRYITFRSSSANLVAAGIDTNNSRDTFIRDMMTSLTTLVSVNTAGVSGNQPSDSNAVSGNGQFVTFQSKATDLVANDNNENADVFLRDTISGKTTILSVNQFGTASAGGVSVFPALSQDGSYASFSSTAPNIVPGDANTREDVFLRDLARGPIALVSVNAALAPANGRSYDPFISQNGDFVVFTSEATDIAPTANNGRANIYLSRTPAPNLTTDTVAPTATFGAVEAADATATTVQFTVNLADETGLDTVNVGNVTVAKADGSSPLTAVRQSVVGTGKTATVTYLATFPAVLGDASVAGTYKVSVPAGAIKDAAGNAAAAADIGTFTLGTAGNGSGGNTGGTGGTGTPTPTPTPGDGTATVGDPAGPNLRVSAVGAVPVEVVGGSKKGKLKFTVINDVGPGTLTKLNTTFGVYLSADGTLDSADPQIATLAKKLTLKPAKFKALTAKFTWPTTGVGDGKYFVLVKADSANAVSESNESDNTTATTTQVLLRQPFKELQPTAVTRPTTTVAGGITQVSVTIKNNANVNFVGVAPINVVVIPAADTLTDLTTGGTVVSPKLSLKPGQSKVVKLKLPFPTGLSGSYKVGVDVDPADAIAESDESNNVFVSTETFSV
jgi:hypothetical protein